MVKITFKDLKTVEVPSGTTILEAAMEHGVPLYHTCGGNCSCSTCHVKVLSGAENLSGMSAEESQVLDSFDLKAPRRLGCQSEALKGSIEVEIPSRAKEPRPNKTPRVPEDAT